MILRTSSSHEEGVVRDFSINTKKFSGDADGNVKKLHGIRLEWQKQAGGAPSMSCQSMIIPFTSQTCHVFTAAFAGMRLA